MSLSPRIIVLYKYCDDIDGAKITVFPQPQVKNSRLAASGYIKCLMH